MGESVGDQVGCVSLLPGLLSLSLFELFEDELSPPAIATVVMPVMRPTTASAEPNNKIVFFLRLEVGGAASSITRAGGMPKNESL